MSIEQLATIDTKTDGALRNIELGLSASTGKEIVVLSDFDHTLCNTFRFDEATNNHVAEIDPDLVDATQSQNLIVATSRRIDNPTIPLLWDSGLVQPHMPVIAENGGVILFRSPEGTIDCIDLIHPSDLEQLSTVQETVANTIAQDIPDGQELRFKVGRTILLARLQDRQGNSLPHHQSWLTEKVRDIAPPSLRVVDTRASVAIQHEDVDKGMAFRTLLEMLGISRKDIFVVGMGDGKNDAEVFEEADLRIGFSDAVSEMVDIEMLAGCPTAPFVMRTIQRVQSRSLV